MKELRGKLKYYHDGLEYDVESNDDGKVPVMFSLIGEFYASSAVHDVEFLPEQNRQQSTLVQIGISNNN